jgi:hypothetical protein
MTNGYTNSWTWKNKGKRNPRAVKKPTPEGNITPSEKDKWTGLERPQGNRRRKIKGARMKGSRCKIAGHCARRTRNGEDNPSKPGRQAPKAMVDQKYMREMHRSA